MKPKTHCLSSRLLATSLLLGSSAWAAQPVTLANPGFENPVVAVDGSFTALATGWSKVNSANEIGVLNPDTGDFTAQAPEGTNVGYVYGGVVDAGMSQVLTATFQADASYTLTVKVGNSLTYAYDGYRVQLLAGGTLLAEDNNTLTPAPDAFVTATVNYAYNAGLHAGLVGQALEIRLLGKGQSGDTQGETEFDDVQLTATLANPLANPAGPYSVPHGGSLSLNGSTSLPSEGQTISTWEWDLDNDGDFDEAITGAMPASITAAHLQTTYNMMLGANTIKLRVTDSSAKTSTTEGTVTLLSPVSTFSSSALRPTFDATDIGYFNAGTPSTAPGQDKWFYENSGAGQPKGQTFTITQNLLMKAVTYRLRSTKKAPVNTYLVRIGTFDPATNAFYQLHSETFTQESYWNPDNTNDSYGTWTLAAPVTLPVNPATGSAIYAYDVTFVGPSNTDWQGGGIPYPLFENTNVFAGGNKYATALGGAAGVPTNTLVMDSGRDREFHIDMDTTAIVDTTAPTLTSINDQVGGGPIHADQVQVTYILNFNEVINPATIDLADFENLGSGVSLDSLVSVTTTTPFPVASVVKVVFGISGTGTLQLGVKSGSNIADFAANSVTRSVADDTTITVNAGTNPGAGNRWWDGIVVSGLTDGVSQGGTATWDLSATNWDRGFGFAAPVAWISGSSYSATFGGSGGTVTLAQDVTLENLTVSLPSAVGTGYSIGNVGEDNKLIFDGTKTVTTTATGTGTNQDVTILAGIDGSPTMNIAGRNTNSVNNFNLLPGTGVTQTIGTLNMLNTLASNKRLILGGESTGNVVDTLTWSVTGNQLMLTKAGTGSWTISNDIAFSTGGSRAARLYVEQGTLTLGGTANYFTHKVGVSTVRESNLTASNQASKLIAKGTFTIGDNREYFYVQNAGTLSPGPGVETLTVRWNANSNATTTHAQFNMQTGSTYEWDIASSMSTDVIDVQTGGSNFANLNLGNMTLKIKDAGVVSGINPTDQLKVFTYETAQPVNRSIGTVTFDTSALGPEWTIGTLALTDGGNGTIYLTGLSKAGSSNTFANWISAYPAVGGFNAVGDDADGDGTDNGAENFFGTNPGIGNAGLVAGAVSGGSFVFTHPQNATPASDLTAVYQWSKDFATFYPSGATDGDLTTVTFTTQLDTPAPGTTTVTATVTGTAASKLFVNVKVTQ
ncbi:MAG: hypothetical protein B9S38_17005 [Verrucomicrobiia bacterium Tous-C4TDCM]|nr:MAG: hypothetical protein B9S38_17005 [Verrucomicrobiae bacterium Tous-C4TDCM]